MQKTRGYLIVGVKSVMSSLSRVCCQQRSPDLKTDKVKPRFNKPLYNETLGTTNDIFCSSNKELYGKNFGVI